MIEYVVKVYAKHTKKWYLNGKLHDNRQMFA